MAFDALSCLFDEALEVVAEARMRHQRAPKVRVEFDIESGVFTFIVVVDGEPVAAGTGASLERAARICRETLAAWHDDQPSAIAHALDVSLKQVRAERAAGSGR